jgi:transcriptional regulator with XRE-family HTH domain
VANRIGEFLRRAGKTQEALAAAAGVTQGEISRYCADLAAPDPITTRRIADFLGVAEEDLELRPQFRVGRRSIPGRLDRAACERAMKTQGINASELARRAGVSRQAIANYFAGRAKPSPDTLRRLAELLDTDPERLLLVVDESNAAPSRPAEIKPRRTARRKHL